jgi:hypothetical protein
MESESILTDKPASFEFMDWFSGTLQFVKTNIKMI